MIFNLIIFLIFIFPSLLICSIVDIQKEYILYIKNYFTASPHDITDHSTEALQNQYPNVDGKCYHSGISIMSPKALDGIGCAAPNHFLNSNVLSSLGCEVDILSTCRDRQGIEQCDSKTLELLKWNSLNFGDNILGKDLKEIIHNHIISTRSRLDLVVTKEEIKNPQSAAFDFCHLRSLMIMTGYKKKDNKDEICKITRKIDILTKKNINNIGC